MYNLADDRHVENPLVGQESNKFDFEDHKEKIKLHLLNLVLKY